MQLCPHVLRTKLGKELELLRPAWQEEGRQHSSENGQQQRQALIPVVPDAREVIVCVLPWKLTYEI